MLKQKKYYSERKFLNKDKTKRAFVIANVAKEIWNNKDGVDEHTVTATLEIADCSKTVYLEFDVNEFKDRKRVLEKIDLLNTVMVKFEQALTHAVADLPEPAEKKKRKKKDA